MIFVVVIRKRMCFFYVGVFVDVDVNKVFWVECDLMSCVEVVFKVESFLWSFIDFFFFKGYLNCEW